MQAFASLHDFLKTISHTKAWIKFSKCKNSAYHRLGIPALVLVFFLFDTITISILIKAFGIPCITNMDIGINDLSELISSLIIDNW